MKITHNFIKPKDTIKKALEALQNDKYFHILLVVDEQNKLIGALTDGDIRRGILNDNTVDDAVINIMGKDPVFISNESSNEERKQLLIKNNIRQLIIVDKNNIPVDIQTAEMFLVEQPKTNKVVIMAGGLGTRLRPLTENIPKPMIKVNEKPILQRIIENFLSNGFSSFTISVNYKSEIIKEYFGDGSSFGCTINYLDETDRLGTAGALSLVKESFQEAFFITNADILTNLSMKKMLDFHNKNKSYATMGVREYSYKIPFGVVETKNTKIENVIEKPTYNYYVNAGVYILESSALQYIPKNKFFDMPDLFHILRKKSKKLSAFPIHEYWTDIGTNEDLKRANETYNSIFQND